jgi:hypothetical protein
VDQDAEMIEMNWSGFDHYRDESGSDSMRLVVLLQGNGEYLEVAAPSLYDASDCKHMEALCRVLLGTSLRTQLVQFSLDESDGEIRATAEMVLMDSACTPKQLQATIEIVKNVIDKFHPHVKLAMEIGTISFPDEGTVIRPSLNDSESESVPLADVDLDLTLRESLEESRVAGRKMWESAEPPRDVGRRI